MHADTPLEPSADVMRRMMDHATARALALVEDVREAALTLTQGEA